MATLVLVRHGQSSWNLENRFTGWWDVPLSDQGQKEARSAGALLSEAGLVVDRAHTSLLTRAIHTLELALGEMGQSWVPVARSWRLNERHYGGLTGLDKAATREKYGDEQFRQFRRSFDVAPPPMEPGHPYDVRSDPRYRHLPVDVMPTTECLADVIARMLPYWYDAIAPDLIEGRTVLVAAHGNSLRALIKHLDDLSDEAITGLEIPTGVPIVYQMDASLAVSAKRELGDPTAIAAAAEAVRRQGERERSR
ncbi:MAG: 2,3-diphosphoglycerate-dependent phosphoglycerate mutase [Actinomycetota bacterium]|nr:2,3-diphosphoglycerate-dependent phosphoglycerate mutase [Actinomycetota bacterium]